MPNLQPRPLCPVATFFGLALTLSHTQRNLKHNIKPDHFKATEVRAQCPRLTLHCPSGPFPETEVWEEFENHCSGGSRNSNYRPR